MNAYWNRFLQSLQLNCWPVSLSEGISVTTRKHSAISASLLREPASTGYWIDETEGIGDIDPPSFLATCSDSAKAIKRKTLCRN